MHSYLTTDELAALLISGLPTAMPYLIRGVSNTQLSIARHYGGITYQGADYSYIPATDELIRFDVVKWTEKRRKDDARAIKDAAQRTETVQEQSL